MCCFAESTIQAIGYILRIFLLFLLICQTILGLVLTITAAAVLKEAAPDVPDTSEEGKLVASLSLFQYAGDVKEFSETAIAKACVMLMCTGILMCGFGIMGFASVASGKPKFLLVFLAILVVSSTAATFVATNLIQYRTLTIQALNEVMEWSLETQYDGNFNSTNRWSRIWDLGHIEFHCCGISNGSDFQRAARFKDVYLGQEFGINVTGKFYNIDFPVSCCKVDESYNVAVIDSLRSGRPQAEGKFTLIDSSCATNPTSINSYIDTGCKQRLQEKITKYSSLISGFATTAFSMQVMLQLGIIVLVYASLS